MSIVNKHRHRTNCPSYIFGARRVRDVNKFMAKFYQASRFVGLMPLDHAVSHSSCAKDVTGTVGPMSVEA